MDIWTVIALVIGVVAGILIAFVLLRTSITQRLEAEFERRRIQWEGKIREQAIQQSQAVIRGKVGEQFAPILPTFKYNPSDARFIGSPIDFVVFDGYASSKERTLERPLKIIFVEVKTSKRPRLTKEERLLRDAIKQGNVECEVIGIEVPE